MSDTICGLRFTLRKDGGVEKAAPSDVRDKITASATGSAKGEETTMAALFSLTPLFSAFSEGERYRTRTVSQQKSRALSEKILGVCSPPTSRLSRGCTVCLRNPRLRFALEQTTRASSGTDDWVG